jgi:hypothetical protein
MPSIVLSQSQGAGELLQASRDRTFETLCSRGARLGVHRELRWLHCAINSIWLSTREESTDQAETAAGVWIELFKR